MYAWISKWIEDGSWQGTFLTALRLGKLRPWPSLVRSPTSPICSCHLTLDGIITRGFLVENIQARQTNDLLMLPIYLERFWKHELIADTLPKPLLPLLLPPLPPPASRKPRTEQQLQNEAMSQGPAVSMPWHQLRFWISNQESCTVLRNFMLSQRPPPPLLLSSLSPLPQSPAVITQVWLWVSSMHKRLQVSTRMKAGPFQQENWLPIMSL